jgi:CheY-like chemotaxis protein/anti-sigma regulatory factor (Ser/Thr protein kinase)
MTSQLLTFAKGGQPALEVVEVERLVAEAADIALGKEPQVLCQSDLAPGLMAVRADRTQIMQALTNLLINARQAMPGGGLISLAAENAQVDEEDAVGLLAPGLYVKITVADQGPGIAPEDLERIFDPFYTTKTGGTGLGLAITHSVVTRHGGHIEVASPPGQGAVFTLHLPATSERPAQVEAPSGGLTAGGGRVLVVDDEQAIREITGEVLGLAGYQATTHANFREGLEAFRQARQEGHPFDLVLFDLSVPGDINGAEAVKQARLIDPGVKAVVASGYSDLDLLANPAKYGFDAAIRKPFSVSLLTQVVAEVMSGGVPPQP